MSKYLIVALVILTSAVKSSAQLKLPHAQIFANINYATPLNSAFKDVNKAGIGAEAGAGLGLGSTMLVGTLGYQAFGVSASNTAGNLRVTSIKGGFRRYMLLGRLFLLGNLGAAIQSYSNSSVTGSNLIYEFGAGVHLFGLELQATQSGWKQPLPVDASNAFNVKLGYSFKL